PVRHRRLRRRALAGAQGLARRHPRRRTHRRLQDAERELAHRRLHLRPAAGRLGRGDGAGRQGRGPRGQDRPLPLQGERQGHRGGRDRRLRQ
ncbi:hypothetical protein LTR94_037532, partial [Friedmanniomyces endolithicus]